MSLGRPLACCRYVKDCKDKFIFGESLRASLEDIAAALQDMLDSTTAAAAISSSNGDQPQRQTYLVGHGMSQDLAVMKKLGVQVPRSVRVLDTTELHWAMKGGVGAERNNASVRVAEAVLNRMLLAILLSIEMWSAHFNGQMRHVVLCLMCCNCRFIFASKRSFTSLHMHMNERNINSQKETD